jgi:hemophore-related protein
MGVPESGSHSVAVALLAQLRRAHPDANNVLTAAGMQGAGAEQSVRDYFTGRPQEYTELRGIAAPLIDLQHGCNTSIQPMQIAALYQALSNSTA